MIGIITFQRAVNYGAVLQCFALSREIEKLGGNCEVINYCCPAIDVEYNVAKKGDFFPVKLSGEYIRHLIFLLSVAGIRRKKKKKFYHFMKSNTNISMICRTSGDLEKLQEKYSAVITGSDQVWNPVLTSSDDAYFLGFVKDKAKKYSYAASFGNMDNEFNLEEHKITLLKEFNRISVREKNGEAYVKEVTGKDSEVLIDPALLASRSVWEEIAVKPKKSGYILVYDVCDPLLLLESAKKAAEKENLEVIYIKDKVLKRKKGITYVTAVSPEEFVGYFRYADYVFTNSFHGTAFSIIFQKKFMVELDSIGGRNKRALGLLELLGLEDREMTAAAVKKYKNEIDWGNVEKRLNLEQKCAKEYLKSIIQNKKHDMEG